MAYESVKLRLANARTVVERAGAIQAAISQGMFINEIEVYLDWLDLVRPPLAESKGPTTSRGECGVRPRLIRFAQTALISASIDRCHREESCANVRGCREYSSHRMLRCG